MKGNQALSSLIRSLTANRAEHRRHAGGSRREEMADEHYGVRITFWIGDFVPSLKVTCTLANCVCFGTLM